MLDLLIEENIHSLEVHSNPLLLSDHYDITFTMAIASKLYSKSPPYYSFNYSKGDYSGHTDFTSCFSTHDIERVWNTIEHQVVTAMKLFIPITKYHSLQHPPWFTSEICYQALYQATPYTSS